MPLTDAPTRVGSIPAGEWSVETARSSVEFTLKHFLFAKVRGRFRDFQGEISIGDEPSAAGTVAAASIETDDAVRDQHLRESADFFDVENHPEISFSSTRIKDRGDGRVTIDGSLQMRGRSKEIELRGTAAPFASPAGEPERIQIRLRAEIERADFGLTWNQKLDTGGALLGNRVKIELELVAARNATR
jgi:polyisoprenoid-binding protein YceI